MRAILQRTEQASVYVDNQCVSSTGRGWLILVGVGCEDDLKDVEYLAEKVLNLRAFSDREGKMNLSILEVSGELMVVSQFTLYGDCRKGRRPSFSTAGPPEQSKILYDAFVNRIGQSGLKVATGIFQANMKVHLCNDGPVTFLLDSKKNF